MKNCMILYLRTAALVLLLNAVLPDSSVHAQCTSYFQSVYNSTTDEVDFTQMCSYDTSIHPLLFMWDFGDGTTIVEENPSHHYVGGNNYLVCLFLFVGNGAGCCQDTFCEQIDFNPASIKDSRDWMNGISVNTNNKNVSLHMTLLQPQSLNIDLVSVSGVAERLRFAQPVPGGRGEINFSLPGYPPGIYLLRIEDETANFVVRRFMLY